MTKIWYNNGNQKLPALLLSKKSNYCEIMYYRFGLWHKVTVAHDTISERTVNVGEHIFQFRKRTMTIPNINFELP